MLEFINMQQCERVYIPMPTVIIELSIQFHVTQWILE